MIFALVAVILAGPAQAVGRCFGELPPLIAYRWDLVGSIIGISAFTLLSFLRAPSVIWGIVAALALVALVAKPRRLVTAACGMAVVATLLAESLAPGVSWSPYYKVHGEPIGDYKGALTYYITVNNIPHQTMGSAQYKLERARPNTPLLTCGVRTAR